MVSLFFFGLKKGNRTERDSGGDSLRFCVCLPACVSVCNSGCLVFFFVRNWAIRWFNQVAVAAAEMEDFVWTTARRRRRRKNSSVSQKFVGYVSDAFLLPQKKKVTHSLPSSLHAQYFLLLLPLPHPPPLIRQLLDVCFDVFSLQPEALTFCVASFSATQSWGRIWCLRLCFSQ